MPNPEPLNLYELATRVKFLEEKIMGGIEHLKESHIDLQETVTQIKEAVYNPDKGLYARLRVVENTRQSDSRVIWLIVSGICGSGLTLFFSYLMK